MEFTELGSLDFAREKKKIDRHDCAFYISKFYELLMYIIG